MEKVKIVIQGAGVSSLALCQLLLDYGVPKGNVFLIDSKGIVRNKRNDLGKWKRKYAVTTDKKTFDEAVQDCASQGAELISLKTEADYSYIKKSPLSDPIATWVGK